VKSLAVLIDLYLRVATVPHQHLIKDLLDRTAVIKCTLTVIKRTLTVIKRTLTAIGRTLIVTHHLHHHIVRVLLARVLIQKSIGFTIAKSRLFLSQSHLLSQSPLLSQCPLLLNHLQQLNTASVHIPQQATITFLDLGTADDYHERLEALNEVAEHLQSTLVTAQDAEERQEADFLAQEDR
jgi:hypothetical protein